LLASATMRGSSTLRRYRLAGQAAFKRAIAQNDENIELALHGRAATGSVIDLGCDDGERTMRYAAAAGAGHVYGIEAVESRAAIASGRGVEIVSGDLGQRLPIDDDSFDVVVSNQVIEHLYDTDLLLSEAFRILKPGGTVVTSTENLASWHNVGSLLLGWQPFSLTNVSSTGPVGNPLGLHVGGDLPAYMPSGGEETWQHRRVFAARALTDLHAGHGFSDVRLYGAGYYPLPRRVAKFNPSHAAFITVSGVKPTVQAAAA
jgi:SAM-dependent methyltransferase